MFFNAIHADPLYALMCKNQSCFRARLSAKPWRIGMTQHIRPRPGTWPIAEVHHQERQRWIDEYEAKAQHYRACSYWKAGESGHAKFYKLRFINRHPSC